jgi:Tfp pilus assembly protein PilF
MKVIVNFICSLVLIFILPACTSFIKDETEENIVKSVPLNYSLFSLESQSVNSNNDIFYLNPEQEKEITAEFNKKVSVGIPRHLALTEMLESRLGNYTYYGETYNAEAAMRLNKGNCMSLAVLTGAFAKFIGVEYSYRKVTTLPTFDKQNNIVLSSNHVQSILYDASVLSGEKNQYFNRTGVVIDYFPAEYDRSRGKISESRFIAMYYKNIAAEALIENNLSEAFILAETAYQLDKSYIEVINLLGVIHRRAGDITTAEEIYKIGLELDSSSLSLMSNYIMLLKREKRYNEAEVIERELELIDDPDPYQWLEQAYAAQASNKNSQAKVFYKKALVKAPYLHQAYKGLYQIYLAEGRESKAKEMLIKALEWTYEVDEKKLYKYKLYSMR